MKTKINNKNKHYFYYFSLNKELLINALLIILIGIFLLPQFAYSSEINKKTIIDLTNQERASLGLIGLTENSNLDQAAAEKADYILSSNKFQHNINGIKFSDWIKKHDYKYSYVGENLAIDFISSEGVIDAWKKSPLHYKNLVNSEFKETGVAVINGYFENEYTTLVVQIFGAPANLSIVTPKEKVIATASAQNNLHNDHMLNKTTSQITPVDNNPNNLLMISDKNFGKNDLILDIDLNKISEQKSYTIINREKILNSIILSDFNLDFFTSTFIFILFLVLCYGFTVRNLTNLKNYGL